MDKYKTCKNCPDRSIHPNCHSTCEGYIHRMAEKEKRKEEERKQCRMASYKQSLYTRLSGSGRSLGNKQARIFLSEENLKRTHNKEGL